jgi:hypothetical protein
VFFLVAPTGSPRTWSRTVRIRGGAINEARRATFTPRETIEG